MKIFGVGMNKVNNIYNESKKSVEKKEVISRKDSIDISSAGKSLSAYSIDDNNIIFDTKLQSEKLESIKKEISNGTYSKNSTLVAQKIIDNIKGREV